VLKKHWADVQGILSDKEGFKGMNQRFIWTREDGQDYVTKERPS